MFLSYLYILLIVFISNRAGKIFKWSKKTSRKLLHVLIGNLSLILPFFSAAIFPVMVAASFILVTFLACPYSPAKTLRNKIVMLKDVTEKGHPLGLVFYSISYTILAALFFHQPYIVAVGILPMAYGDSFASLVGEHFGKLRYKILTQKSVEGSSACFAATLLTVFCGLMFYSFFYNFCLTKIIWLSLLTAGVATVVEAMSPSGLDNLTVPMVCATFFYALRGG